MPALNRQLTAQERLQLLQVISESFERRNKSLRAEQYQLAAQLIQRLDREKAEQLLRSLTF